MSRTAIKSAAAIASLAVLVPLTGCGPIQMGAAAIIDGQRITTSALAGDVAALNRVYQANPSLQRQVQYTPGQMPQLVLMWLVRFRVVDDIAKHDRVQVSDGDAQRSLAAATRQLEQQAGGAVSTSQFAMFNALPPPLLGDFGRYVATVNKLASVYTGLTNVSALTPAQQRVFTQRIDADVAAATRRLDIRINPRFGQLDARRLSISPAPDTLSRPASS